MDAAAELGRNPVSKHRTRFSLNMEMSRLARDGTAEPVSRDQILRRERGQGIINFPCSADHEQDWQPHPVDPYSAIWDDHTNIHTYGVETSTSLSQDGAVTPRVTMQTCTTAFPACHSISQVLAALQILGRGVCFGDVSQVIS